MWILPKQLHTSPFVPDTAALISDSTEQSEICAQSLLARSKPSPARTWSQRWKRDSWTQHLSGRILKPSHGPSFVTAWTSALSVIHASHLVQPVNDSEQKIPDTSGHLLQPELLKCDQVSVSPRTSRDISALGYPTCCKTWQDWVTERRGAWRARVNAARLTRGSGSSSWLTISTEDACRAGSAEGWKEYEDGNRTTQARLRNQIHNWPSPVASEVRQGFQDRSKGMKGSQESLTTVVIKHGQAAPASSSSLGTMAAWPTPNCMDVITPTRDLTQMESKGHWGKGMNTGKLSEMVNYGQAAPASSSSLGSRQGLWTTPTPWQQDESEESWEARKAKNKAKGYNGNGQGTPLDMQVKTQSGKLNPRWVETLMGLPIGWTMPSCIRPVTIELTSCDSSGMALCRPAQSGRSEFFLVS
jgi:hypothetical protein